jgi:hypothetical protein
MLGRGEERDLAIRRSGWSSAVQCRCAPELRPIGFRTGWWSNAIFAVEGGGRVSLPTFHNVPTHERPTCRVLHVCLKTVNLSVGDVEREPLVDGEREPPIRRDHYYRLVTTEIWREA